MGSPYTALDERCMVQTHEGGHACSTTRPINRPSAYGVDQGSMATTPRAVLRMFRHHRHSARRDLFQVVEKLEDKAGVDCHRVSKKVSNPAGRVKATPAVTSPFSHQPGRTPCFAGPSSNLSVAPAPNSSCFLSSEQVGSIPATPSSDYPSLVTTFCAI